MYPLKELHARYVLVLTQSTRKYGRLTCPFCGGDGLWNFSTGIGCCDGCGSQFADTGRSDMKVRGSCLSIVEAELTDDGSKPAFRPERAPPEGDIF